MTMNKT